MTRSHPGGGSPPVVVRDLTYTYPSATGEVHAPALEGVSLDVRSGELLAVVGPNGAGKTTLLRVLLGLLSGYTGEVRIAGRSPDAARRSALIGSVPQRSAADRAFPVTAAQVVWMAAARRRRGHAERVRWALEQAGVGELAERRFGDLSGGQQQRVLIARALAVEPAVLVLDEPMTGVDAPGQAAFVELLRVLKAELGLAIVMVMHDLRAVASRAAACDRVACLRRTVHFHDAPGGVTPQILAEVFGHDLSAVFGDVQIDAHPAAAPPNGPERA